MLSQKLRYYACFCLLWVLVGLKATAMYTPSAQFRHLTTADGLPHGNISAIVQDKYGFIWIGTKNGLCRYDGYSIVTFRKEASSGLRISDNNIMALCLDSIGNLWVGTWKGGLNRINLQTETCTVFKHDSTNTNSIGENEIRCLYCSRDGTVWAGTWDGGVSAINNGTIKTYHRNNTKLPSNIITTIAEDSRGGIWIGSHESMYLSRFLPSTNTWIQHNIVSGKEQKNKWRHDDGISTLKIDKDNTIWVATYRHGLKKIQIASNGITQENIVFQQSKPLANDEINFVVNDIYIDSLSIWLGTVSKGIFCYNKQTGNSICYNHISSKSNSLGFDNIRCLFFDNRNILWLGTRGSGVNILYPFFSRMNLVLEHNAVLGTGYHILADSNNNCLWLSSSKIYKYVKPFTLPVSSISSRDGFASMVRDNKGFLWASTAGGLRIINPRTNHFVPLHLFAPQESIKIFGTESDLRIFAARNGSLILGSHRIGLYRYSFQTRTFSRLLGINPHHIVACLIETSREQIVLSDYSGALVLYNKDQTTQKYSLTQIFKSNPEDSNSISNDVIYSIKEDSARGVIWSATYNGLSRYNLKTGKWHQFYEKDGLPNNVVYGIIQDHLGDLWVTTAAGLAYIRHDNRKEGIEKITITPFTHLQGFSHYEFLVNAYFQGGDGTMYLGTRNAVISVNPQHIKQSFNTLPPSVYITQFRRFSTPLPSDTAIFIKNVVELEEKDNVFSLDFVALNYFYTEANAYSYMLEGFDKEWSPLNKRRSATYTNLSAGTYTFRVKASNNDGVMNEIGATLVIIIHPPWWKTMWAYMFYGCFMLGLVFSSIKYREKRQRVSLQQEFLQREAAFNRDKNQQLLMVNTELEYSNSQLAEANRRLEELNTERSEFMGIVAHDLKNPLVGIQRIGGLLLENIRSSNENKSLQQPLEIIFRSAEKMFALVQQLLVLSKTEYSEVSQRLIPIQLVDVLTFIIEDFQPQIQRKKIKINFQKNIPPQTPLVLVDPIAITQIFENLLSNAIKFSPIESSIHLSVEVQMNHRIQVAFRDEGEGIRANEIPNLFSRYARTSTLPTAGEHSSGLGLFIVKRLTEAMRGRVWCESQVGVGSTFFVEFQYMPPLLQE